MLNINQITAINNSKNNDFSSGIHFHATGTGKSWIAMHLLNEFNIKYPKMNVIWICERKDILSHQFNKKIIKDRNFSKILQKFNILNYVENKNSKWYESLNISKYWGKPYLCIINRAYLVSLCRYRKITESIDLVIHDECHSIENITTQLFYRWLHNYNNNVRVIGFSATPLLLKPLNNIISVYSIYSAFLDNVIVPPKIVWLKYDREPTFNHFIKLLKVEISQLPYKKIIVWCGVIDECIKLSKKWRPYFIDYLICVDYYKLNNSSNNFQQFYDAKEKAILFCAVKHREGSDIPNIDACIFLDCVTKRSKRVFIQCMGRVLRKDKENKKKYGLVIDVKAKSTIELCNRVQSYLDINNIFPWKYEINKKELDSEVYYINSLFMIKGESLDKVSIDQDKIYTKNDIFAQFKREIPKDILYKKRLEIEIELIISNKLFGNIMRAIEILELTKNIPHVTRGSCGSSLVCYLIGISHIDPIKYNICFSRFINKFRKTLPDIDFDFPHYLRDEVFLKLFQKWGNKVARISNHNYYHEKSALRESLRINGINKFISKFEINREINSYDPELKNKIIKTQKELEGRFKGFSLHCGGIIYFPDGIPDKYILKSSKSVVIKQVNLNKVNVAENRNFKIDILSSCALSQLYYCRSLKSINFNENVGDKKTIYLLSNGINIGLTLAETPLIRKALLLIKPKNIHDLAICLAIIRPAAKNAQIEYESGSSKPKNIIFDDNAIYVISKLIGCDEQIADKLRRGYCKKDKECLDLINEYLKKKSKQEKKKIKSILNNLRKYSFCKAHAMSYAQLVWQLAYEKANNPRKFWISTLKNITTCYRKWVHVYEARRHNVLVNVINNNKSIYAKNREKNKNKNLTQIEELKKYGYWTMKTDKFFPDCYYYSDNNIYYFRGLIASSKIRKYKNKQKLIIFAGVLKGIYIEIEIIGEIYYDLKKVIIKGYGKMKNQLYSIIECNSSNIEFL